MTVAVAHRDQDGIAVLDAIREFRPPFSPEAVVVEIAALLKSYKRLARDRRPLCAANGRASGSGCPGSLTTSRSDRRPTSIETACRC